MTNLEFIKRRSTHYLYIVPSGQPHMSFEETYREAIRNGEFDTGYHFFIDNMGVITEDRNVESIAGNNWENYNCAVYVLIEAESKPNDCQKMAINELQTYLEGQYGTLEVIQDK